MLRSEEIDSFEKIFEDARSDSIEDYWGCNSDTDYICANCPAKICDLTPAEFFGTDDCEIAIRLDLLMRLIYFWLSRDPEEPNKGESECSE
jgi:hypothetical protein